MNSDFDSSIVDQLIEEALTDSVKPQRVYGQIGFMESEVVSSIFSALDSKISNATYLEVVRDARISSIALSNKLKITDLHTVTHNCRKCSDTSSSSVLPKWNVTNPDVMFITDSSYIDQQSSALFVSALKSSGFTSEKVCLTYLLRCHIKNPDKQHVDNCVQYLHNEIQIMNPKLICTIGANSLNALMGMDCKLKDYKNKITWLGSWPILPLYSLNYILKAGDSAVQSFQADMNQAYQFCYKKAAQNDIN